MGTWSREREHLEAEKYAQRMRCRVECGCSKGCWVEPGLKRRHNKPDGNGTCRAWRYPVWGEKGKRAAGEIIAWHCPSCLAKTPVRWQEHAAQRKLGKERERYRELLDACGRLVQEAKHHHAGRGHPLEGPGGLAGMPGLLQRLAELERVTS